MRGKGEGGGEEVDEDEEDEEAEDGVDEEGENQVVPWSMTPPTVASSTSSRGVTPHFLPQYPNKTQENKKQAAIFTEKSGAKPGNMLLPHLITSLHLSTAAAPGAYEVLRSHGLPIALLPKGVREFEVDGGARFRAGLDAPPAPPSSRARFATMPPSPAPSPRARSPPSPASPPRTSSSGSPPRHRSRRQRVRHHPL
ncbi:unnamed protein product [Musa acuminata var. zebrina]